MFRSGTGSVAAGTRFACGASGGRAACQGRRDNRPSCRPPRSPRVR